MNLDIRWTRWISTNGGSPFSRSPRKTFDEQPAPKAELHESENQDDNPASSEDGSGGIVTTGSA
jgi:hypothetical protein